MINIAIMGHGVVGSGVAEILINHNDRIKNRVKQDINVKHILDLRDFDVAYSDKFTKDFDDILNDDSVSVVAEVMGGITPAYDFVKACLLNGKSVVTSNKELVAAKGAELIKIANQQNVSFLFEASVGGGIPVLRPISNCLAANEIDEIWGILNGTTNYILNKMIVDNMDFASALKLAQDLGFAERNPAADVEGHDACRKICILSALAYGKHVYPDQVKTEGITEITLDDVEYADNFGAVIKLIGHSKKVENGKIIASVRPTLVSRNHILAGVNGVFNAVVVNGDQTGEVAFYGKGAGKEATASAVVGDIIDCIKNQNNEKYLTWEDGCADYVDTQYSESSPLYVTLKGDDFAALKGEFSSVLSDICDSHIMNEYKNEIAFITKPNNESFVKDKLTALKTVNSYKILHTMF